MLKAIRWNRAAIDEFIGCYLSEPKPTVLFSPPARPLSSARFAAAASRHGVRLDARTQMLYDDRHLFVNGEALTIADDAAGAARALANERALRLSPGCPDAFLDHLHQWYRDGYLHVDR